MTTTAQQYGISPERIASPEPKDAYPEVDLAEHQKTYRWFVRGALLFAAHVAVVLLVLGYIFSDSFV